MRDGFSGQLERTNIFNAFCASGNNQLSGVKLFGLKNLERLILINNSIGSMKDVILEDLFNLRVLSLSRNMITHIKDNDLASLGGCKRYEEDSGSTKFSDNMK